MLIGDKGCGKLTDEIKTDDEKRLEKYSARGKKWNNHTLVFFGCAVVWLLLLTYADMEPIIGALGSLALLVFTMALAFISLIISAYYIWQARILKREIEYYSTDPEIDKEKKKQ